MHRPRVFTTPLDSVNAMKLLQKNTPAVISCKFQLVRGYFHRLDSTTVLVFVVFGGFKVGVRVFKDHPQKCKRNNADTEVPGTASDL